MIKGKKGIFFVGQPHHMRLWHPVLKNLEHKGMKIKYVTSHVYFPFEVSAFRYGEKVLFLEDLCTKEDLDKEESLYTKLSKEFAGIYESNETISFFPLSITGVTLREIIRETLLFSKLLKIEMPDIIFALHELNRWSKLLAMLSFKFKIPFVTLQEGAYYFPSYSLSYHTEYSTVNFIWGKQTLNLLVKLGNAPEKNWIVGDTHLDKAIRNYISKSHKHRKKIKRIFNIPDNYKIIFVIQGSGNIPLGSYLNFLDVNSNYFYIVKFHPTIKREFVDNFREKYERKNLRIVQDADPYQFLAGCDLCISMGVSTLTFEAFAFRKPVVEVKDPDGKAFFEKFNVCHSVEIEKVNEAIKETLERREEIINSKNYKDFLTYVFYKLDGKATNRVVEGIEFILSEREFYYNKENNKFSIPVKVHNELKLSVIFPITSSNFAILNEIIRKLTGFLSEDEFELNFVLPEGFSINKDKLNLKFINTIKYSGSLAQAFNKAIENSKGKYILLMSEEFVPLSLGKEILNIGKDMLLGAFIVDRFAKLVHCGVVFDHNNVIYRLYEGLPADKVPIKERVFRALDFLLFGSKELFYEIGKFDERIHNTLTIVDYSLSASTKGKILKVIPQALSFLRFEDSSLLSLPIVKDYVRFYTKWRGIPHSDIENYISKDGVNLYSLYQEHS